MIVITARPKCLKQATGTFKPLSHNVRPCQFTSPRNGSVASSGDAMATLDFTKQLTLYIEIARRVIMLQRSGELMKVFLQLTTDTEPDLLPALHRGLRQRHFIQHLRTYTYLVRSVHFFSPGAKIRKRIYPKASLAVPRH